MPKMFLQLWNVSFLLRNPCFEDFYVFLHKISYDAFKNAFLSNAIDVCTEKSIKFNAMLSDV